MITLGEHLPGLFKSLADRFPRVALVLAGSKRHVMQQLVLDQTAPLYGMATTLALSPIPADVMADFLVRRASAGGKELSREVADRVVELSGPVPRDIQYLAYEVYGAAGAQITERDVENGMRLAVDHEADFDAWRFDALAPGQKRILAQLAAAPAPKPYSDEFRSAAGLRSPGAVGKALNVLETELGLIAKVDGAYRVTSPFFARWLRSRP